jgi:hypothetical protein
MPLDEFLPDYHENEIHSTRVAAAPVDALAAARALTAREVPLVVALMALRRLPARLLALRPGQRAERPLVPDGPILDTMLRGGFVVLAERPDELVLGVVGRFWEAGSGVRRVSAAEFSSFHEPGFAKAAVNFHVRPDPGGGTVLTTETRIQGTDERARRVFHRYWRVIRPGSAAIRRIWLRAIRRRAERAT